MVKTECFYPKIKNKARTLALTTSIRHCARGPNQCGEARKRHNIVKEK